MTVTSHTRGHRIVYLKGTWVYEDTDEPIDEDRPCKQCGAVCKVGEPDPCLGKLPGVANACCGHGRAEEAYVMPL